MIKKFGQYSGVTGVVYRNGEQRKFAVVRTKRGYSLPGGGFTQKDRSIENALSREIKEELGLSHDTIEIKATDLAETFQYGSDKEDRENKDVTRQIFLVKALSDELNLTDNEVLQAKWYTFDEALEVLSWPNSKDTLRKIHAILEALQ